MKQLHYYCKKCRLKFGTFVFRFRCPVCVGTIKSLGASKSMQLPGIRTAIAKNKKEGIKLYFINKKTQSLG